ncbi:MAG TPA: metal-dependent transcriptional regulator [Candidatus Limnocylindria bacterium]|nr:metal-dependent transcriptional regulator [Candidatus Limnocylindria bacterium]
MYLETILTLSREGQPVHAVDVAKRMGFSKPSVSRAVGILRDGGFLTIDADGHLHLTPRGRDIAQRMMERHTLLTEVLVSLGVDRETAAQDACRIEHDISEASMEAIKRRAAETGIRWHIPGD